MLGEEEEEYVANAAELGRKGGSAHAKAMTPEERAAEIARKAAAEPVAELASSFAQDPLAISIFLLAYISKQS
ncbi:MAG TPA: hypothetical protein VKB16_11180 [Beijerinckiaceae bacterium]|nr:hypothetical protein [Beijerinckiaceae bacterium]